MIKRALVRHPLLLKAIGRVRRTMKELAWMTVAAILTGCSAHGVNTFGDGNGSGNDPVSGGGSGGQVGMGTGDGNSKFVLYAHSDTTLYELDPENLTKPMQLLGNFDCIAYTQAASAMNELALGTAGTRYGAS